MNDLHAIDAVGYAYGPDATLTKRIIAIHNMMEFLNDIGLLNNEQALICLQKVSTYCIHWGVYT